MSVVWDVSFLVLREDYHGVYEVNTVSRVILLDLSGSGWYEQRKMFIQQWNSGKYYILEIRVFFLNRRFS